MAFGGFLGMGEDYHPLLWSMPTYDTDQGGNVVNLDKNSRLATRGADEGHWEDPEYTSEIDDFYGGGKRPFLARRALFDASHADTIK